MEPTTLREIFSKIDRKFEIPAYQRAYSWDKEQINQFIDDLREVQGEYYLGHFLFEQDLTSANTLFIIDGQQRLTTCVIFFSALHHELKERLPKGEPVPDVISAIGFTYLRHYLGGTQRLRVIREDNNFFADEIIDRKFGIHTQLTTESQRLLRQSWSILHGACKKEDTASLYRWCDLVAGASCTEYKVLGKVEAARIFAFQNDRGIELSNLEKLKSYCMLQLYLHGGAPAMQDEHLKHLENSVSEIYRQIVKVNLEEDDVLRYCWQASSPGPGFNSADTIKEIKKYIAEGAGHDICARIREFMSALAEAFKLVETIEKSSFEEVRNLRYLDNMALSYPFLIRAHRHGATPEQLRRLVRLLENITFRAQMRGGRAEVQSRLQNSLRMAADATYVERLVERLVCEIRTDWAWSYWSDPSMNELLESGNFYKNRVDNYLLWRYEIWLCQQGSNAAPLKVEYHNLISNESIEHIAPQTETDGDPVANGYGTYEDATNPEYGIVSGEWMHCLGNLMLISQSLNSSIGNRPFEKKLASYGSDNLLNQQKEVIEFVTDRNNPVWDQTSIARRHNAILNAAKEMWCLDNI